MKRSRQSNSPRAVSKSRQAVGRPSAREGIVDLAIEHILEEGVESLTFEGLAKRTGLTKGGILYHFPSREDLYLAIRQRVRDRYHAARQQVSKAIPEGPARELKAWVIAGLKNRSKLDAVSSKIMASGLWSSEDSKAQYRQRFDEISAGAGFDRSSIVYLATEGLWFLDLAKFSPFSSEQRQRVVDLLLRVADGGKVDV